MRAAYLSHRWIPITVALAWPALGVTSPARAAEYHVAPGGDDGSPGTQGEPWATIAQANATLQAGDIVWLHAGTYADPIRPDASGSSDDARIIYQAFGDGDVVLQGFSFEDGPGGGALGLGNRDYVSVIGRSPDDPPDAQRIVLQPTGDVGFLGGVCGATGSVVDSIRAECAPDTNCNRGFSFCVGYWDATEETSYNVLRNSHLVGASVGEGSPSDYTEDLVTVAGNSHHNLIEDNVLEICRHSLLYADSPASHTNVVRGNVIDNPEHSALSIWSAGVSHADGARFLVEGNILLGSAGNAAPDGGPGNAFQWGSDELIIRHNQISAGGGAGAASSVGGLSGATSTSYGSPYFATDGRVYHNTIVANEGVPVGMFDFGVDAVDLGRHVFANNVLFDGRPEQGGDLLVMYWDETMPTGDRWVRNVFGQPGLGPDTQIISTASAGYGSLADATQWEGPSAPVFASWAGYDNVYDNAPGFEDAAASDYRWAEGSAYVDAAAPLTRVATTDAGEGATIVVEDARFFFAEASEFPAWMGVEHEWIRVGDDWATAVEVQVTAVDDAAATLTVDGELARSPGQFVWLASDSRGNPVVAGEAPDIGAFELGIDDEPPPGGDDGGSDDGADDGGDDGAGDDSGGGDSGETGGLSDSGNDGGSGGDAGGTAPGQDGASAADDADAGCACASGPHQPPPLGWMLVVIAIVSLRRRPA